MDRVIKTFCDLVRIPGESGNELETAQFSEARLKKLGFEVEYDGANLKTGSNCPNLYARIPGNVSDVPPLLFNAHMDTVFSGGKIVPEIIDGKIVSHGNTILGADNRAGITMILEGMKKLIRSGKSFGPIEIVLTTCEEIGLVGARYLEYGRLNSKHGYVFDSSGLGSIVLKGPYYNALDIKVLGRASHAGVNPGAGLNSIAWTSSAISRIPQGNVAPDTTLNIGRFSGGTARNIVSNECTLECEVRSHSKNYLDKWTKRIKDELTIIQESKWRESGKSEHCSVDCQVSRECDGFEFKENSGVVEVAKSALGEHGIPVNLKTNMGGSDANVFIKNGIETLTLGTGQMDVHSSQEYIMASDLISGVELVPRLIQKWITWSKQKKT